MSNEFKSANSVKTGKKFKDKRVQMNYTLNQVAEIIYINKNYLIAIENGDYSIFPSESFAKAYFKKYAKYLNIKYEFPSIFEQEEEIKYKKIPSQVIFKKYNKDRSRYLFMAFATVILLMIVYFFAKAISTVNNMQNVQIIEYQEDLIPKISDADVVVQENLGSEILSESVFTENNADLDGNIMPEEKNMLILEFFDDCWIEVYFEDELIEAQFFNNNDKYNKQIDSPFKIVVGNVDSVKGTYNGEDIDFISNADRLTRVNTINFLND